MIAIWMNIQLLDWMTNYWSFDYWMYEWLLFDWWTLWMVWLIMGYFDRFDQIDRLTNLIALIVNHSIYFTYWLMSRDPVFPRIINLLCNRLLTITFLLCTHFVVDKIKGLLYCIVPNYCTIYIILFYCVHYIVLLNYFVGYFANSCLG